MSRSIARVVVLAVIAIVALELSTTPQSTACKWLLNLVWITALSGLLLVVRPALREDLEGVDKLLNFRIAISVLEFLVAGSYAIMYETNISNWWEWLFWPLAAVFGLLAVVVAETPVTDWLTRNRHFAPRGLPKKEGLRGGKLVVWAQGTGESGLITSVPHRQWTLDTTGYDGFAAFDHAKGGYSFPDEVEAVVGYIRWYEPTELLLIGFSLGVAVLMAATDKLEALGVHVPTTGIWSCGVTEAADVKAPVWIFEYAHGYLAGWLMGVGNFFTVLFGPKPKTEAAAKKSPALRAHKWRRALGSGRSLVMQLMWLSRLQRPESGRWMYVASLIVSVDKDEDILLNPSARQNLHDIFPQSQQAWAKGWIHNDVVALPQETQDEFGPFLRQHVAAR